MFGYIRPHEDELKIRNYKLYKAVYCGLCKTAGKRFGVFSRFFLSYDYTFFAIVRMILCGTEIRIEKQRCGFHPFKKRDVVAENDELALSAAIFTILTYHKLLDTIYDESFIKSLGARLLLPIVGKMRKKVAKSGYAEVNLIISDCMEKIAALEEKTDVTVDTLSEAFGDMLGYLLKFGITDEKDRSDAFRIGSEVGKFIYRTDALDDLEKDERDGTFNPLLLEFGSVEKARSFMEQLKNAYFCGTDTAADILSSRADSLSQDGRQLCEIAQNILYLGCPRVTQSIFRKDCKEKCRK